jgi:hypothetical protein
MKLEIEFTCEGEELAKVVERLINDCIVVDRLVDREVLTSIVGDTLTLHISGEVDGEELVEGVEGWLCEEDIDYHSVEVYADESEEAKAFVDAYDWSDEDENDHYSTSDDIDDTADRERNEAAEHNFREI